VTACRPVGRASTITDADPTSTAALDPRRSQLRRVAKRAASLIEDAEATLEEASGVIANGYLRLDPQSGSAPSSNAERRSDGDRSGDTSGDSPAVLSHPVSFYRFLPMPADQRRWSDRDEAGTVRTYRIPLSGWRHGFEPRWDYERKPPGQGTSSDPSSTAQLAAAPRGSMASCPAVVVDAFPGARR
jgi:hypothetical protein